MNFTIACSDQNSIENLSSCSSQTSFSDSTNELSYMSSFGNVEQPPNTLGKYYYTTCACIRFLFIIYCMHLEQDSSEDQLLFEKTYESSPSHFFSSMTFSSNREQSPHPLGKYLGNIVHMHADSIPFLHVTQDSSKDQHLFKKTCESSPSHSTSSSYKCIGTSGLKL